MLASQILRAAEDAFDFGDTCVLCTVVRLDGSGYGRPGARLLLTSSGERVGYISGGCLEKDLCRRVWSATERGPRLMAFDTRGRSMAPVDYNTGCEGIVFVLCQRLSAMNDFPLRAIRRSIESAVPSKLLTVYRTAGDEYQLGDSWLECEDQRLAARTSVVLEKRCETAWLTRKRNGWLLFQDSSGREVEAAIEVLTPPRRLIVFGAGDDVIPVVTMARRLEWQVTVVGTRPELANARRFTCENETGSMPCDVHCGPMHDVAMRLELDSRTDVVVMSHDFVGDVALLPVLLRSNVGRIGILGPKRRLARLMTQLHQSDEHWTDQQLSRIRSPIGLDIGGIGPEEIAVSIIAELIAEQRQRSGHALHDRKLPLHDPIEPVQLELDLER